MPVEPIESGRRRKRTLLGGFLVGTGFLACPCHLPLTLPLLAGTALGAFANGHPLLLAGGLGLYFLASLSIGFRFLDDRRAKGPNGPEPGP